MFILLFIIAAALSGLIYNLLFRYTSIRGSWLGAFSGIPFYVLIGIGKARTPDDVLVRLAAGGMVLVVLLGIFLLWGVISKQIKNK